MNVAYLWALLREQVTVERLVAFAGPLIAAATAFVVALAAKYGLELDPALVTGVFVSIVGAGAAGIVKLLTVRSAYNVTDRGQADEAERQRKSRERKDRAKR